MNRKTAAQVTSFALILIISLMVPSSRVNAAIITAASDTYISSHPGLGGSSTNHGTDDLLALIGPAGGSAFFQASPLFRFDLSSFGGSVLTSDVELNLNVSATFNSGPESHIIVGIYEVLIDWDELTVTLDNFGSDAGLQPGTDFGLAALDLISPFTVSPGDTASFMIPFAKVQSWIDSPSSNHGLILISEENNFNKGINFGVRELGLGPTMTSDELILAGQGTVPEPASLAIWGGIGIAGLFAGWRRKRMQSITPPAPAGK
ncbi:MAG: DNRLRE domain-containing protein [Pirellulaceae bacterium]|nr:DNRLRE domain-containing protein [Pirellulaceae bacterium]